MKCYKVFICVFLLLLAGCARVGTVYITGEDNAIGSKVFIDEQFVGILDGRFSKDDPNIKKSFAIGIYKIKSGTHTLTLKNSAGKILSKQFQLRGENYFGVDFSKSEIQGGE